MRERDYLWCLLHLMLDEEETLDALCPPCRERADKAHCPSCGGETTHWAGEVNLSFDRSRFDAMQRGEIV